MVSKKLQHKKFGHLYPDWTVLGSNLSLDFTAKIQFRMVYIYDDTGYREALKQAIQASDHMKPVCEPLRAPVTYENIRGVPIVTSSACACSLI